MFKKHHGNVIKLLLVDKFELCCNFKFFHISYLYNLIFAGSSEPKEESPVSYGYSSRPQTGFEGRYSHYSRYKDPDTISQTSFRSINEVDYGRIQDTQENERLLFQVYDAYHKR